MKAIMQDSLPLHLNLLLPQRPCDGRVGGPGAVALPATASEGMLVFPNQLVLVLPFLPPLDRSRRESNGVNTWCCSWLIPGVGECVCQFYTLATNPLPVSLNVVNHNTLFVAKYSIQLSCIFTKLMGLICTL